VGRNGNLVGLGFVTNPLPIKDKTCSLYTCDSLYCFKLYPLMSYCVLRGLSVLGIHCVVWLFLSI
jgi:hypothetical protein